MTIEPISPKDLPYHKKKILPSEVLQVFNDLIAEKYNQGSATVRQEDVIIRIMCALNLEPENRKLIWEKGYLNVEDVYRERGWKVEYHKPDYTESWKAYFVFSARIDPHDRN